MSKQKNKQFAYFQLLLVLVVAIILSSLLIIFQTISSYRVRNSVSNLASEQAFFAAEGAIHESYNHLRNNPDWPEFMNDHYSDSLTNGNTIMTRNIYREESGNIRIEIIAKNLNYTRKLMGSIEKNPVDTVVPHVFYLAMDNSSSMQGGDTFTRAKNGVIAFINTNAQYEFPVGILGFAATDLFSTSINTDYEYQRDLVNDLEKSDLRPGTNMERALDVASQQLTAFESPYKKTILLFSDGLPTIADTCEGSCNELCPEPNASFQPAGIGSCCSNSAINQAREIKNSGIEIYSILLTNQIYDEACTLDLARRTMAMLSSENYSGDPSGQELRYYKETVDPDELAEIFSDIVTEEAMFGNLKIWEVAP